VQIFRQLHEQGKLREGADNPDSPSYVRDRTPLKKGQITASELRDEFRKDPSFPILLSDDVFRKLIRRGIEEGIYIYQRDTLLAGAGDPMPQIQIDEQSIIFTTEFAKQKGLWPRPTATPTAAGGVSAAPGQPGTAQPTEPLPPIAGPGMQEGPAPAPTADASARSFIAEGVLKEALRQVFEKAKSAKFDRVDRLTVRLFEYGDAFKLVPVVGTIQGAKKSIALSGSYQTTEDSTMEFEFSGTATDASTMKGYLEPQFRAAKETALKAALGFDFDGGLDLGADADKFIEKLTRFASAAAHVEAIAEIK
jgi:hypothetical protein